MRETNNDAVITGTIKCHQHNYTCASDYKEHECLVCRATNVLMSSDSPGASRIEMAIHRSLCEATEQFNVILVHPMKQFYES